MSLYELRRELIAIATEAESTEELLGALSELLSSIGEHGRRAQATTGAASLPQVA